MDTTTEFNLKKISAIWQPNSFSTDDHAYDIYLDYEKHVFVAVGSGLMGPYFIVFDDTIGGLIEKANKKNTWYSD